MKILAVCESCQCLAMASLFKVSSLMKFEFCVYFNLPPQLEASILICRCTPVEVVHETKGRKLVNTGRM